MRSFILIFFIYFSCEGLLNPTPRMNFGSGRLGPCDRSKTPMPFNSPQLVFRKSKLAVRWEAGSTDTGFVRLAIVPYAMSDNSSAFDANTIGYYCFSRGMVQLDVPESLNDGYFVLQWARFGNNNDPVDRYACSDVLIAGGSKFQAVSLPVPVFRSTDGKCPYVNSNQLRKLCKVITIFNTYAIK